MQTFGFAFGQSSVVIFVDLAAETLLWGGDFIIAQLFFGIFLFKDVCSSNSEVWS